MEKKSRFAIFKTLVQMVKFGLVGVANTAITLSVIFLLTKFFSVPYVAANAVGYIAGLTNSYLMNRIWTFRSKGSYAGEGFRFILVFFFCYLMQLGALVLMKEVGRINQDLAQVLAMVLYTLLNFILNKVFTYKKVEE